MDKLVEILNKELINLGLVLICAFPASYTVILVSSIGKNAIYGSFERSMIAVTIELFAFFCTTIIVGLAGSEFDKELIKLGKKRSFFGSKDEAKAYAYIGVMMVLLFFSWIYLIITIGISLKHLAFGTFIITWPLIWVSKFFGRAIAQSSNPVPQENSESLQ